MITHSLKGQSGSQMINEQWPLTFDLWGRTLSARATGWAVSPGWADLDTSSSLCHRPRRSYFFRCPITTLPTKVLPYTSLPSFFEPFVLQHIFNGKFLSITKTAHIRLLQPPYVHRWDVLMEPSGLGQNTVLFFGLHPIILKNGPMSDWPNGKSLLFFPVVSTFVPLEYRFHFPPLCVWIILHCIYHILAVIFFHPRCIKMRTAAKCYPCVVSLYFALDAKQVNRPTGFL